MFNASPSSSPSQGSLTVLGHDFVLPGGSEERTELKCNRRALCLGWEDLSRFQVLPGVHVIISD